MRTILLIIVLVLLLSGCGTQPPRDGHTRDGLKLELTANSACVEPNGTLEVYLTLTNTTNAAIPFAPLPEMKIFSGPGTRRPGLAEYYWHESADYPSTFPETLLPGEAIKYTWTWQVDPDYAHAAIPTNHGVSNYMTVQVDIADSVHRDPMGARLVLDYKKLAKC